MNTVIISWLLSALSYDEKNIGDYISTLLPGFKCHLFSSKHGGHFFGVVTDDKEGRAWQFNRGTDGYDIKGNARSWLANITVCDKNENGVFDGIEQYSNEAFDKTKKTLEHFDVIYVTGHSQGGMKSPYVACLCVENLMLTHCHFNIFAPFPAGNEIFAKRVNNHIDSGTMSGDRFLTYADPINSYALRQLTGGKDVGTEIILPRINRYQLGPANAVNHSCALQNAALITHFAMMGIDHAEYYKMLGEIAKRIVN